MTTCEKGLMIVVTQKDRKDVEEICKNINSLLTPPMHSFDPTNNHHFSTLFIYHILKILGSYPQTVILDIPYHKETHEMINNIDNYYIYRFKTLISRFYFTNVFVDTEREVMKQVTIKEQYFVSKLGQMYMLRLILNFLQDKIFLRGINEMGIVEDLYLLCYEYSTKNSWNIFLYEKILTSFYFNQDSVMQEEKNKTLYDILSFAIRNICFIGRYYYRNNPYLCLNELLSKVDDVFLPITNYVKIRDSILTTI